MKSVKARKDGIVSQSRDGLGTWLEGMENVTVIHNLIMALEYEYLIKRCQLDTVEGLGAETAAVKKAIKERIEREKSE